MKDYLQPSFYHFSSDSIELAKLVSERHKKDQLNSLCDAFAGCGVIALEIARSLKPKHIIYNEFQEEFIPYIEQNHQHFAPTISFAIAHSSFSKFQPNEKIDLLVANPPYFNAGEGRVSHNTHKHICRHFVQDDFNLFIDKMFQLRKIIPYIYFVTREEITQKGITKLKSLDKGNSIYHLT